MENIDNLFHSKVSEMKSRPEEVKWRKEKSWQKLKKKQKKHRLTTWMKYAAAVIILASVGHVFLKTNHDSNKMTDNVAKYQKDQQQLQEMNQKLGIIGEVKYVCDNCVDSDYYVEYKEYQIKSIDDLY